MELCNDEDQCNRLLNHEGDHGYEVTPGLIIAPRRNAGKESPRESCDLTCLWCDGPMEIGQAEHGGRFYCQKCNEVYSFDDHGFTSYQTTIFPSSNPHKYDSKVKEEFITHWRKKRSFTTEGMYLLGLTTAVERDAQRNDIEKAIVDWWDEDERFKRPFWQFWKKA